MALYSWSLYLITLKINIFKHQIALLMTSSRKIWLGIFTFLPFLLTLVYIVYFFTFFLGNIIEADQQAPEFPVEFLHSLSYIIFIVVLAVIIKVAVMIYYIVHVSSSAKDSNTKIMWIVLLVLVSSIASLVYYFVEILPSSNSDKPIGYQKNN